MKKIILTFLLLIVPVISYARVDIDVDKNKIVFKEELKPGSIVELTPLIISNTGDRDAIYKLSVENDLRKVEKPVGEDWLKFSNNNFLLERDKEKKVEIKLFLPINIEEGHYFTVIQTQPVEPTESGKIEYEQYAKDTRLYFTVKDSSRFTSFFNRIASLFVSYSPWSYLMGLLILVLIVLTLASIKYKFRLRFTMNRDNKILAYLRNNAIIANVKYLINKIINK